MKHNRPADLRPPGHTLVIGYYGREACDLFWIPENKAWVSCMFSITPQGVLIVRYGREVRPPYTWKFVAGMSASVH